MMLRMAMAMMLVAGGAFAAEAQTVVEVFTSKYCPNCPAVEKKLTGIAGDNPDLLMIFEHVDYWDRGDQKDPYGLKEATERQYDYSNSVSERPGQVFTPMPLLNGQWVAAPPLWLSWESHLKKARAAGPLPQLRVEKLGGGGLQIAVPKDINIKNTEVYLLGVEKDENSPVRRLTGIQRVEGNRASITVPKALTPKSGEIVVLLQEAGPKAVLAMGWLK